MKLYPELLSKVQITVFDVAEKILSSFQTDLSEYATKKFQRSGIQIRTSTRITEVTPTHIILQDKTKVPYGCVVWATGLTATPLVKELKGVMKQDASGRIMTDDYLKVLDSDGTPYQDM